LDGDTEGEEAGAQLDRPDGVRQIFRATVGLALLGVVVRALGFVEKLVLAYFFGTGVEVDAYLVAYSLPFSAYIVLRDVIEPAFLPTFLRTQRDSPRDARRLFWAVGAWLVLLLGVATAAGIAAAAPLISAAAPGFSGPQQEMAIRLTRLAMPALLFLGLSTLTTAALHAQKRFALPAAGEASFRTAPLVLFLAVGRVASLALGVVVGAVGKLLIEGLGLVRGGLLRPVPAGSDDRTTRRGTGLTGGAIRRVLDPGFPPLRTAARLAAPLFAGLFFSLFIGPLVDNAFASKVGVGGVSALAYARKIGETLTTILPYTLGLVLFPFSAEMAASQDRQALARTLTGAIRAMALVFLPVTVGLIALREPFIRVLLERGAFGAASTQLTAGPLLFYSLGLLPFALEIITVRFFYAQQNTLTPVVADVAAFCLNVALIPPLMAVVGLGGIALATTVAKTLKVLALLILFGRRVPAFRLAVLGPFAAQMAVASVATGAALLAVMVVGHSLSRGTLPTLAYLAAGGLVAVGVFFVAAYLLKVEEIRALVRRALNWAR
jgi:putative peptidoglycan lipid II flippase